MFIFCLGFTNPTNPTLIKPIFTLVDIYRLQCLSIYLSVCVFLGLYHRLHSLGDVTTPLVADGIPRLGERCSSGTGGRSDDPCKESRDDPHTHCFCLFR